jgi:hypothetical protein
VLGVLDWFDMPLLFQLGHLFPLSTLLRTLRLIAETERGSELACAYDEVNTLLDLQIVDFGFSYAMDGTDLTLHLLEGGEGSVKAFYASGVNAILRPPPRKLQGRNCLR